MAKNHFPQVSQWSFGGYLVYESDLGILSYLRLLKKSRTMHPSHQSNLLFVLNTIKVRRKEKQSSCPLNIKLIKWANILPCLILFVYCIQHAIHTHNMLPLVLPYDNFYRSFSWFLDIVYPELFRPDQARLSGVLVVNDEYTKVKHPNSTQSGASGCLVASKRHRKRQTPKLSKNCEAISAWHLTQTGEVELMFVIWQLKSDTSFSLKDSTGPERWFLPGLDRPRAVGVDLPRKERQPRVDLFKLLPASQVVPLHYMDTDKVTIFETTLYKSCVQLFPMLPST